MIIIEVLFNEHFTLHQAPVSPSNSCRFGCDDDQEKSPALLSTRHPTTLTPNKAGNGGNWPAKSHFGANLASLDPVVLG